VEETVIGIRQYTRDIVSGMRAFAWGGILCCPYRRKDGFACRER